MTIEQAQKIITIYKGILSGGPVPVVYPILQEAILEKDKLSVQDKPIEDINEYIDELIHIIDFIEQQFIAK